MIERGIRQTEFSLPHELTAPADLRDFLFFYIKQKMPWASPRQQDREVEARLGMLFEDPEELRHDHHVAIKKDQEIVAIGRVRPRNRNESRWGNIADLSTADDYKGNELAVKIIGELERVAKDEEGCVGLYAEVVRDNPIGLVPEFQSGLILVGLDMNTFHVEKKFSHAKEEGGQKPVWQETKLNDARKIRELLREGWYGVDIKNIGDAKNNKPADWKLIFEKK